MSSSSQKYILLYIPGLYREQRYLFTNSWCMAINFFLFLCLHSQGHCQQHGQHQCSHIFHINIFYTSILPNSLSNTKLQKNRKILTVLSEKVQKSFFKNLSAYCFIKGKTSFLTPHPIIYIPLWFYPSKGQNSIFLCIFAANGATLPWWRDNYRTLLFKLTNEDERFLDKNPRTTALSQGTARGDCAVHHLLLHRSLRHRHLSLG